MLARVPGDTNRGRRIQAATPRMPYASCRSSTCGLVSLGTSDASTSTRRPRSPSIVGGSLGRTGAEGSTSALMACRSASGSACRSVTSPATSTYGSEALLGTPARNAVGRGRGSATVDGSFATTGSGVRCPTGSAPSCATASTACLGRRVDGGSGRTATSAVGRAPATGTRSRCPSGAALTTCLAGRTVAARHACRSCPTPSRRSTRRPTVVGRTATSSTASAAAYDRTATCSATTAWSASTARSLAAPCSAP